MLKRDPFGWIFLVALALLLIELATYQGLSGQLALWYCGPTPMPPAGAVGGEGDCGFNADMHLTAALILIGLISGSVILIRHLADWRRRSGARSGLK